MRREGGIGLVKERLLLLASSCIAILILGEALDRGFWLSRRILERGATTDVFEIYAAGESTAVGEPYGRKLAPFSLVADQFRESIGGREIRTILTAARGQSIYPQSVVLERLLRSRDRRNPGIVMIYTGHNDLGADFSPPSFGERLCRVLTARSALLRDVWYLVEQKHPSLRFRSAGNWEYRLRRVIETSLRSGVTPILATAVSNVAGIDPGLAVDDVPPAEASAILDPGTLLESRGRPAEALRYYGSVAGHQEQLQRYLKYRIARCHQALRHYGLAKRLYQEVVDSDMHGNFGRATRAQNGRIRSLAAEYGVPLVDAEKIFEARSPHGILGDGLFSDGHHPNVEGYRLLAVAYAREISRMFREPVREPLGDATDCLRRASFGRGEQSEAMRASGSWLFSVAARHSYPRQRLEMSRERFRRAYELDPGNPSAWLGIELAGLARRSALLLDEEGLDWLGRWDLFYVRDYRLECRALLEVFRKYDKAVDAADLERRCRRATRAGRLGR